MVFSESAVGTAKESELAVSLSVRLLGKLGSGSWGHVISRLHLPALHTGVCEALAFPAYRACEHEHAPPPGGLFASRMGDTACRGRCVCCFFFSLAQSSGTSPSVGSRGGSAGPAAGSGESINAHNPHGVVSADNTVHGCGRGVAHSHHLPHRSPNFPSVVRHGLFSFFFSPPG